VTEFHAARELAHAAGLESPRATETVELADAAGRTLAAAVVATAPLPGFDAAAMDGWVVADDGPWMLGAPIKAGDDIPTDRLAPGAARPISTGAPLPPGSARVIRSERGEVRDGALHETLADTGRHIRAAGEEAAAGEVLVAPGTRMTPPRIALAAGAGYDVLDVVTAPTVRLLVLGDEVVASGRPIPGRVRDVFTPSLPAVLAGFGTRMPEPGRVGDSLAETASAIAVTGVRLLVTTGGSARGPADHVRESLAALDAEILLDGIRMRPGHPLLLARLGDTLALCLPGNPLAAYVGLVAIGGALVDGMLGRALAPLGQITLAESVPGGPSTRLVPVARATPTDHQGAGMLRGLAEAELLAIVPPTGAALGDSVEFLPLPW
jgi:molybdopterin molybdotransferase